MPNQSEPKGAKPPLVGLVKIQLLATKTAVPTGNMANVLHGRFSDSLNHSVTDLATLATNVGSHYMTRLGPYIAGSYTLSTVVVSSLGGDGLSAIASPNTAGTGTGFALPPQCSVCISLVAGLTARGGRGRIYMWGIPDSATTQADSQEITTAYATNVKTAFNNFITDISAVTYSGANLNLCVPSYYNKYALRPVPIPYFYTTCNVHQRLDSQRRRSGKESSYPRV